MRFTALAAAGSLNSCARRKQITRTKNNDETKLVAALEDRKMVRIHAAGIV
jgi:hypothetical protein